MSNLAPNFFRCGDCRHATRLNRELHEYTIIPKCICGSRDWRVDNHRRKQWVNREGVYSTCHCSGLHHPHRKGSSVWCDYSKVPPSEEDYIQLRSKSYR